MLEQKSTPREKIWKNLQGTKSSPGTSPTKRTPVLCFIQVLPGVSLEGGNTACATLFD